MSHQRRTFKLHLAPMEGVVDWVMRDLLTQLGGIDQCVTEFIRVTNHRLSDDIFYKYCPELKTESKTRSGTPVFLQLLGGQAEPLADNALRAHELGAAGIDFNFGCPAKTVNRHDGGAALLKTPERLYKILQLSRRIVPESTPVTAKIRLGFDDPSMCLELAQAVEAAGISTLTVHCRTKLDLYKPPAHWEWIPEIKAKTNLNIVANGDIASREALERCASITGCAEFMIGRGAIQNPFLFQEIQLKDKSPEDRLLLLHSLLLKFYDSSSLYRSNQYALSRTKQWLSQISKNSAVFQDVFSQIKTIQDASLFRKELANYL